MTGLLLSAASAVVGRLILATVKAALFLAVDVLELLGERR